ncbi:MAG: chaperone modulator CbpM [Halieaceae bacterium]|jgi:chaperone modulatory protein CbpM|nr:chaperone modulator CbpM [Halieaceae bacterium]
MSSISFQITVHELCDCEDISEALLIDAVEHEVVAPVRGRSAEEWVFDVSQVTWIRRAIHLREDLELDWVAIAMLIDLLREKEHLEGENQALQRRLQRFLEHS